MPIIKRIQENNCQIAIWEITESLKELLQFGKNINHAEFKSEKRKKEAITSRLLLNELLPNTLIYYNKYGSPEINSNYFISISHTTTLVTVIISKRKVAIDIEKISPKPLEISSKFISKNEAKELTKERATLIWSVKEVVFKWHQKGNVNFIKDIKIKPFSIYHTGEIMARFQEETLTLHYKRINKHFLVYLCK